MKSRRRKTSLVPGGGPLFQRMFTRLGCDGRPPRFRVEFYPYSSLVLTIRRREEVVFVRFSDLLQRACTAEKPHGPWSRLIWSMRAPIARAAV